jgi:hypothetical protein
MEKTIISVSDFGKDHWSLLGYVESRIHSNNIGPNTGELDKIHLRINPNGDYNMIATPFRGGLSERTWDSSYGTRLKGYWNEDGSVNPKKQVKSHDDINCLDDLESAGIIEVLSLVNLYVKLTPEGVKIASSLREWKNKGNNYAEFTLND